MTTIWKASWALPQWKTMTSQHHQKSHLMLSSKPFLLKRGTISTSHDRNWNTFTSRTFLTMHGNHTWSKYWPHPNAKSCCLPHLNYRLAIEIGQRSISLISRDKRLYQFCCETANENDHYAKYKLFLLEQVDWTRLTSHMMTTTSKNRFPEDSQSSCSKKYEDLEGSSLGNIILLIGYDHGDQFD